MWPDIRLLRKRRTELGLTQRKLSELSGIPQSAVSRIEKGAIADPSYITVVRLFDALHDYEHKAGKQYSERQLVARDVMSTRVVSVRATDRVKDAWSAMRKHGFDQLPVIDDKGRIVGGIFLGSLPIEDESLLQKTVSEVIGDSFPVVGPKTKLETIAGILQTETAALVLEKGVIVGIITRYDLLERAYRHGSLR